ncbi:MAG: LysM peptidoglycan-binding domain-containing protein [Cytophagales bacterium]|nr:LysM peptidoglycan-binding domain-containing protein [Cytophagales bacterium]
MRRKINKLTIKAYKDEKFSSQQGEFTAAINPENLKITSGVDYHTAQGLGVSGTALKYKASLPRVLTFSLLFDGTGIFPDAEKDVEKQVNQLKEVIYNFQGSIHEPYYLRVIWGTIDFQGKLTNLALSYTMFQANGAPIRAQAEVVIVEHVEESVRSSRENRQSPDVTHRYEVKEGDTLPAIALKILGDVKYTYLVAHANNLNNIRKLKPGTQLYIPPVAK